MSLYQLYERLQHDMQYIPRAVVVIQVGSFYEILDRSQALFLSQSSVIGLKLRKCNYCNHEIVGFNYTCADTWIERILHEGFNIVLVDEIGHDRVTRRKNREISKIITPSSYHFSPTIIISLELCTTQYIQPTHQKAIVGAVTKYSSLNQMIGAITETVLAHPIIEIYTEDHGPKIDAVHNILQQRGNVVFRHVQAPVLTTLLSVMDPLKKCLFSTEEPFLTQDLLVDSTSFDHLRIHDILKYLSSRCRTRDGKHVLALMLSNPSIDMTYIEEISVFRLKNSTLGLNWTYESNILRCMKWLKNPVKASKKNIQRLADEISSIQHWCAKVSPHLTQRILSQWKIHTKAPSTPENDVTVYQQTETLLQLIHALQKRSATFLPVLLLQNWRRMTGHDVISLPCQKHCFMIKRQGESGYHRHELTEHFEDLYESEMMLHRQRVQREFDDIVEKSLLCQFDVLGYTVGFFDVCSHIKNGCHPKLHPENSLVSVRNLYQPKTDNLSRELSTTYTKTSCTFNERIHLLRGSNGSGKSTFARSLAQCAYMAQCGLSVCADIYSGPLFDSISLRFGANDDFNHQLSSFQNECKHMSEILDVSTSKSLILIDELGMVCSERIGSQICRHVIKKLRSLDCLSIFLTHYTPSHIENLLNFNVTQWTMGTIPYTYDIQKTLVCDNVTSESFKVLQMIGFPFDTFL